MGFLLIREGKVNTMNQNYSNFFSGLSSGGSNWYTDWASIKNGSYRTLMKAYYGTENSSSSSSSGVRTNNVLEELLEERRNPKVSEEVQEANSNLTSGITSLKSSVSALQNESLYTDSEDGKKTAADKVSSAVKNYVSMYNDVVNAAKKSTLGGKTSHVAAMMKATAENADKLAELGITVNANGTLQLNEGKLKAADVSKVQELFSTKDAMSYGSRVMSRLGFAGITSGAAESTEKEDAAGTSAAALRDDSELLASDELFEKLKDKDGIFKYDMDKIFSAAESFVKNYNDMFDAGKSSTNSGVTANLARIREKTEQYADTLKKFGISVDADGRMKIDEDKFRKSDMSELQEFFKEYNAAISTNVSLVDYYMTTKANPASTYTPIGTYDVQGSARFSDFV